MAKLTKRLLIICLVVLVVAAISVTGFVQATTPEEEPVCYRQGDVSPDDRVTKDDAIYLLYATIPMFKDAYPLNQDCDFEADGVVDRNDALYLLYASIPQHAQSYPLKERVHNYHTPVWQWDEAAGSAVVQFLCGCGETHTETATVVRQNEQAATCTTAGSVELKGTLSFDGKDYENTKLVTLPATGNHRLDATPSCTVSAGCLDCDYEVVAPGHKLVLQTNGSTAATCTAAGTEHYECTNEGCTYYEDVALAQLPHALSYLENQDLANGCTYTKRYSCSGCGGVFSGTAPEDIYTKHSYTTKLTREVTCSQTGEKKVVCTVEGCDHVKETQEIPQDSTKHKWDEGVTDNAAGKITYTCIGGNCGQTRVEVIATEEGTVQTSALNTDTGVNLGNNTSLTMDQQMLNGLQEEQQIQIKVEPKSKDQIGLDSAQQAQIPSDTVYDFSMTDANGDDVTFTGYVTISLPYTLDDGDDIDSIDIWYINDDGEAERVNGTYSNGFVTFTTNHFSYYTVTRLTPAERCARLGAHIEVIVQKAATCTEEGYWMKVCQRCGAVVEKEVYNKLAHDYKDTTVPATCTEAGSVKQVCQRTDCGHTVNKVVPAKGHDMKRNDQASVDATCANPGKLVKVCANGCGHTTEEVTKQLEHNHVKDSAQSKAATCTAGGYDLKVCACGDTIKTNETLPLGHDYQAEWKWADDGLSAEVTLTCANKDCTASKTLNNPVITKDEAQSENATCLGSGASVYLGTVSYNSKTYDSKKEVTVQAPGHKPDSQLQTSATQHYYVCTVCQEKVDVENHAFDEGTVTKGPTCVDTGMKHITCQVCDYQKEQVLSATGEHTYVNGTCSVCGFAENACRHVKVYATPVDVSGYDICDGLKLVHYSCDCGQNQYTEYVDGGCRFGERVETEGEDENGLPIYHYTGTCLNCGLVEIDTSYSVIDTENCTRTYKNRAEFVLEGQTIATVEMTMHKATHPGVNLVKTVELTQAEHGMCGEILEFKTCPCGQVTTIYSSSKAKCQWEYEWDPESNDETYVCYTCGTKQVISWEYPESDDPCKEPQIETWTYYKDGQVVYTVSQESVIDAHNFEVANAELLGDSCTDGILISWRCADCGHTDEELSRYHETLNEVITDISGAGICADQLVQATCLCDQQFKDCYLRSSTGNGCQLQWYYDNQTGTEYRACINCGTKVTESHAYGEKGEDCLCTVEVTRTYITAAGKVIGTGKYRYDTTRHNIKQEYTLQEGAQSCEDGVIRRQYCTDCDYEDSYTLDYHETYDLRVYDLTQYDACNTALRIRGCACGQEVWHNWDGMGCNWSHLEGTAFSSTQKCLTCGLVCKTTETRTATDDPCVTKSAYVVEISKEGKQTLTLSYERDEATHDSIYTLTLNPGATDCNGGYTVTERCQRCGYTSTWENGGHATYTLQNEVVAEEGLCSVARLVKTGCACGQYGGTRLNWEGNECQFVDGTFSREDNTWTYTCIRCGGIQMTTTTETPVEGQLCQMRRTEHAVYKDQKGNELFTYDNTRTYIDHDDIYTFEGESCTSGYYLIANCRKCGRTEREDYLYTNCGSWDIAKQTLLSDNRICGDIVLVTEGCPCGSNNNTYLASECRFDHVGYEAQTGRPIRECAVCGLRMIGSEKRQSRPNSCVVDVTVNYSVVLGEETLSTIETTYTTRSHVLVTQYVLNGESCTDGYTLSKKCCYCDKTEHWADTYYEHETRTVGYYRLADYGACGGELYLYSCACGQEVSQGWGEGCRWKATGVTDEEGLQESYCETCGLYRYEGETGQKTGCYYEGVVRFKLVKDGQTVLDVTVLDKEYRHSSQVLNVSLENPGTTCENGVVVTYGCRDCDYISYGYAYHHYQYTVKTVDLSQLGSSCGGYIYQTGCACGHVSGYELDLKCDMEQKRKEQGDALSGSEQIIRTCEDCGLVVESNEAWTVDESTCMKQYTGKLTAVLGSSQEEVDIRYNETSHDYGPETIILQEGAKSCIDGIRTTATCKRCQYVYNDTWGYHRTYAAETIDLAQLGATCGGSLVRYTCACGQENRLDVSEDTKCQLDQQRTDLWIEDAINDWQYGSDGHHWFESQAYTLTCAVTEAACKLQLRVAEYWLVEDCVIREYQAWQYFDTAADQWKDITTIDTGYAYGYHDYTQTQVDTTEDGVKVTGTKYDCACGSYYYDLEYVNANGTKKRVMQGMDTTGENAYRTREQVIEYNYLYDGNCFITLSRDEYQHNSGSTGWYQDAYTYDPENPCNRTRTYTNSSHDESQELQEHFYTNTHWEPMTGYTCTQPGAEPWTETCMICDQVVDTGTARYDPLGHDFYSGVCNRCGLESENGASGNIVLEDMTEAYGGDTSYVVGYWSKKDESFINTVSVILEGAPEGSEDLYLEGISFVSWTVASQGVRAVAVDRALVDQLAAQAVADAGHTGGYAIRLNFVVVDGVQMNYAITLDSVTAE